MILTGRLLTRLFPSSHSLVSSSLFLCASLFVSLLLKLNGSNPAADLLDKLGKDCLDLDAFLIEMTKIFCATHELEIDLLMQVYEALSKAAENTGRMGATAQTSLDFAKFVKILPILGIEANSLVTSDYFIQCNRSQEHFVDWVLNNTLRFESGAYRPLIQDCANCLNVLLTST